MGYRIVSSALNGPSATGPVQFGAKKKGAKKAKQIEPPIFELAPQSPDLWRGDPFFPNEDRPRKSLGEFLDNRLEETRYPDSRTGKQWLVKIADHLRFERRDFFTPSALTADSRELVQLNQRLPEMLEQGLLVKKSGYVDGYCLTPLAQTVLEAIGKAYPPPKSKLQDMDDDAFLDLVLGELDVLRNKSSQSPPTWQNDPEDSPFDDREDVFRLDRQEADHWGQEPLPESPFQPEPQQPAGAMQSEIAELDQLENRAFGANTADFDFEMDFGNAAKVHRLRALLNTYAANENGWDVLNALQQLNKNSVWQKVPFTKKGQTTQNVALKGGLILSIEHVRRHLSELQEAHLIKNLLNPYPNHPMFQQNQAEDAPARWVVTSYGEAALRGQNPKIPGQIPGTELQRMLQYEVHLLREKEKRDEGDLWELSGQVEDSKSHVETMKQAHDRVSKSLAEKVAREPGFAKARERQTVEQKLLGLSQQILLEEELTASLADKYQQAQKVFEAARDASRQKLQGLMAASVDLRKTEFNQDVMAFTSDLAAPSELSTELRQQSLDSAIKVLVETIQSDMHQSEARFSLQRDDWTV